MSLAARTVLSAGAAMLFLFAYPDKPAPPTIALRGITNLASRMPPRLPGGQIARGSLFRISGWRLGLSDPATADPAFPERLLAGSAVQIRQGSITIDAFPVLVSVEEIDAVMPLDAPLGDVEVIVIRDGQASRPSRVRVVEASFGIFSRNRKGWGPGEIRNADGSANSLQHSAHPGEPVRLTGTGLGTAKPSVYAGGKLATVVRAESSNGRKGADEIEFTLPDDIPDGCYVPIVVQSMSGIFSNTVTLAVSRAGNTCVGALRSREKGREHQSAAILAVLHLDLRLTLSEKSSAEFHTDLGYGDFWDRIPGGVGNAVYLFPPQNTCASYTSVVHVHDLFSPLQKLGAGPSLDAGENLTVTGLRGKRVIARKGGIGSLYSAVLGGSTPLPMREPLPLFLEPGSYQIHGTGGRDIAAFNTPIDVRRPMRWKNRDRISNVTRSDGPTIEWSAAAPDSTIVIIAMNALHPDDAVAMCLCTARGADGRFRIPPYALANIPPSGAEPENFPVSLLFIAEMSASASQALQSANIDVLSLISAWASGRSVTFR